MVSEDQSSEFTAGVEQLGGGAPPKPLVPRPTDPCIFVIFGASGDLTGRKLGGAGNQTHPPNARAKILDQNLLFGEELIDHKCHPVLAGGDNRHPELVVRFLPPV